MALGMLEDSFSVDVCVMISTPLSIPKFILFSIGRRGNTSTRISNALGERGSIKLFDSVLSYLLLVE
jgi:hypothetical protein